jgi:cytidylate kinase
MADERTHGPEMRAITISRQYGSGGGEVAARLARRLGWQLIDHAIVAQVARRMGITEEEAHARDERVVGVLTRILSTMGSAAPEASVAPPLPAVADEEAYYEALRHIVESAADTGRAVIVGRGAQAFLRGRRDVLHVRVVAPLEQRITYVARREGLDDADARARIQLKDRDRARFLQVQHHCNPDDPLNYDLVINTAILDLDGAVDLIALALVTKARRLSAPESELGPGTGMAPYPGSPADLVVPADGP